MEPSLLSHSYQNFSVPSIHRGLTVVEWTMSRRLYGAKRVGSRKLADPSPPTKPSSLALRDSTWALRGLVVRARMRPRAKVVRAVVTLW